MVPTCGFRSHSSALTEPHQTPRIRSALRPHSCVFIPLLHVALIRTHGHSKRFRRTHPHSSALIRTHLTPRYPRRTLGDLCLTRRPLQRPQLLPRGREASLRHINPSQRAIHECILRQLTIEISQARCRYAAHACIELCLCDHPFPCVFGRTSNGSHTGHQLQQRVPLSFAMYGSMPRPADPPSDTAPGALPQTSTEHAPLSPTRKISPDLHPVALRPVSRRHSSPPKNPQKDLRFPWHAFPLLAKPASLSLKRLRKGAADVCCSLATLRPGFPRDHPGPRSTVPFFSPAAVICLTVPVVSGYALPSHVSCCLFIFYTLHGHNSCFHCVFFFVFEI